MQSKFRLVNAADLNFPAMINESSNNKTKKSKEEAEKEEAKGDHKKQRQSMAEREREREKLMMQQLEATIKGQIGSRYSNCSSSSRSKIYIIIYIRSCIAIDLKCATIASMQSQRVCKRDDTSCTSGDYCGCCMCACVSARRNVDSRLALTESAAMGTHTQREIHSHMYTQTDNVLLFIN